MPDHELEQPLSPELVLVSPDLRERACSAEPDAQHGSRADVAPAAVPPAPAPAEPAPAPASEPPHLEVPAEPPRPAPPPLPELPLSTQTTAARVEWRLTVGAATVLALTALLIFGAGVAVGQLVVPPSAPRSASSLPSSGDHPTTPAPIPAAAPGGEAGILPSTALETLPTPGAVTAPSPRASAPPPTVSTPAVRPATAPKPAVTPQHMSAPAPARGGTRPAKTVRPIPDAGYVFVDGWFQLSPDGRAIVRFTATTTCAGRLVLPSIRVSPTGTFAYSGHPAGTAPGTTVRLNGRFASRIEARGTVRTASATCRDTTTPFVAHLS